MAPERVFAAPPSFAADVELCRELGDALPGASWNGTGRRLSGDSLVSALGDCRAAIVGLERVDAALLERCPGLELVAKYGVGLDNIDLDACRARGVEVRFTPGLNRRSVAEVSLGFLLAAAHGLFEGVASTRMGEWRKPVGARVLSDCSVGIIGLGAIGCELVRLLAPLGCRVVANDIADRSEFCRAHGVVAARKEEVLAGCDFLSLHVPLTVATRNLIDARALALLRPEAWLINTARGEVVDEAALRAALEAGRLAGAALDVLHSEPPADRALLEHPRVHCTPHLAGSAREAVRAMGRAAIGHVLDWLAKAELEGEGECA